MKFAVSKPSKSFSILYTFIFLITLLASPWVNAKDSDNANNKSSTKAPKQAVTQTSKPTVVILLGAPGSGKGTQAVRLAEALNIPHISTGDILRENIKNGTELGKKVKGYMDAGKLAPDSLITEMVFHRIAEPDSAKGYILDGYPRTTAQAQDLDKHLKYKDRVIVVYLDVSDDKLVQRILNRAKETGVKRADDTPEVAKQRLKVYHQHTKPVIDYYKDQSELITIQGDDKTPDEVFKEIMTSVQRK